MKSHKYCKRCGVPIKTRQAEHCGISCSKKKLSTEQEAYLIDALTKRHQLQREVYALSNARLADQVGLSEETVLRMYQQVKKDIISRR